MSTYYRESFKYPPIRMFLDSENATSSLHRGDAMFCLNQPINLPNNVVCYVSLNEMLIANMEYCVSSTNNLLYFQDTTLSGDAPYVATVPVGNYTATSLATALTAALKVSVQLDDGVTVLDTKVSVEFITLTGLFKFSSTQHTDDTNDCFQFMVFDVVTNVVYPNNIIHVIGFESKSGNDYVNTDLSTVVEGVGNAGSNIMYSTKMVDLSGQNCYYFSTNLSTDNRSFLTSANAGCNVLAKIHYECDTGGIQFHRNIADYKTRISDKRIPYVRVMLHDEDFMPYTPASKWSATLEFTFYEEYESSDKITSTGFLR